MFGRVLNTTLLSQKDRKFPALVEISLLKNSFKKSGNLNFLVFLSIAFGFII